MVTMPPSLTSNFQIAPFARRFLHPRLIDNWLHGSSTHRSNSEDRWRMVTSRTIPDDTRQDIHYKKTLRQNHNDILPRNLAPTQKANVLTNHFMKAHDTILHMLNQSFKVEVNASINFVRSSLFYTQTATQTGPFEHLLLPERSIGSIAQINVKLRWSQCSSNGARSKSWQE